MNKNLFFILSLLLVVNTAPIILHAPLFSQMALAQTGTISPTVTPTQDQKLQQLDVTMGEHTLLNGQLMIARYAQRADYNAAKKAVDNNTTLLAAQIGDFYNTDTKNQFVTLWNRHINDLLQYADARRNNDTAKANDSMKNLQSFTGDMAALLAQNNKGATFNTANNFLSQHILDEKAILDAYINKDYDKMYTAMHDAYQHATSMTSLLAK